MMKLVDWLWEVGSCYAEACLRAIGSWASANCGKTLPMQARAVVRQRALYANRAHKRGGHGPGRVRARRA